MNDTATGPWREALGFIDSLLSTPEAGRERLLAELATARPELHSRVRALLEADAEATRSGFLRVGPADIRVSANSLSAGVKLGPYRIERELGVGGMGEVWLARRDDGLYEGQVAIKTLHPFFAHGVMRERFLREAQLLGRLTHPHIARLLDAGVADGVVYLVLEYVRGQPIDAYCDAHSLGIDARLELFGDVCAAVAHAHANLIVHRDIKPANILVDAEGRVKLLDFGIGKIVENEPGEPRTELTRVTGRIFTPEFAAPEQILGDPVTTATDVYSLGTLLYALLVGVRPFGNDVTGSKAEHAVLHEEPKALGRAASDADAQTAAHRGLTPARLQRALERDLEDIVHLALRKTPQERYGSVAALAEDLKRHARHEPVLARTGSRAYRMNRFVRRHRVAVAATAGVLLAAAFGVSGVLYQAREAREQARLAQREAAKATGVKDYLLQIFEANSARHPQGAQARKTTAEELMDIATREILGGQVQDPEVRVELLSVLQEVNGQMEKYPEQEALGKERIRVAEQSFGPDDVRLADTWNDHSEFLRSRGRFDEARAAALKAVELREAQGDASSWTRGMSEVQLGQITYGEWDGKGEGPIPHFRRAIDILGRLPPEHQLARAWLGLARSYEFVDRYDDAIEANRRGIAVAEQVDGPRANAVAGGHQQMARALAYSFRLTEAERHLDKAVEIFTFANGPENGFTTMARLDVGRIKIRRGDFRAATAGLEQVLAIRMRVDGPDYYWTQQTRLALAFATFGFGDMQRTQELLADGLSRMHTDQNRRLQAQMLRLRALVLIEQARHSEALAHLQTAEKTVDISPNKSTLKYQVLIAKAMSLVGLARLPEAQAALDAAAPLLAENDKDPENFDTLLSALTAASLDLARDDVPAARLKAGAALKKVSGSARRAEAWTLEELAHRRLAEVELAAGNKVAACAALDESIRLRTANALSTDPRLLAARKLKTRCA